MSMEEINLDDLFEEEKESTSKSKSNNKLVKKSEKEKHDEKKKNKKAQKHAASAFKGIMLKSVLPAFVVGGICFVAGAVMFTDNSAELTKKVQAAKTVKSSNEALEKADAVRDAQLTTLKKQLSELTSLNKDTHQQELTEAGKDKNNLSFVSDVNAAVTHGLDEFFTKLIAVNPNATEEELKNVRSEMTSYFTSEAATSKMYSLLTGPASSKELNDKTIKIGSVTVTLASSTGSDSRRYLVIVPFAALGQKKVFNAYYIVQTDSSYKISDIKYAGYSDSVYTKVAHQLYKTEDEVNKEIVAPEPAEKNPAPKSETPASSAPAASSTQSSSGTQSSTNASSSSTSSSN